MDGNKVRLSFRIADKIISIFVYISYNIFNIVYMILYIILYPLIYISKWYDEYMEYRFVTDYLELQQATKDMTNAIIEFWKNDYEGDDNETESKSN